MSMHLTDDIRSVTELKRKTRAILDQIHQTGRPVVLTVNGKADAVLMELDIGISCTVTTEPSFVCPGERLSFFESSTERGS